RASVTPRSRRAAHRTRRRRSRARSRPPRKRRSTLRPRRSESCEAWHTIPRMRVVNRTAVTITGAQPYIDWMRETDADFNKGAVSVPRAKAYGSAFLLPEFDLEEDLQEWVEENAPWLFEFQLSAWTEDDAVDVDAEPLPERLQVACRGPQRLVLGPRREL